MFTDAIVLLKDDHKQLLKAFMGFEQAGENATVTKGRLVDKIIDAVIA